MGRITPRRGGVAVIMRDEVWWECLGAGEVVCVLMFVCVGVCVDLCIMETPERTA